MVALGRLGPKRQRARQYLRDTCVITPRTSTVTDSGGTTTTSGTPTSVKCLVAPVATLVNEGLVAAAIQSGADYVVTLPAGTVVAATSTITWQGRTLEVTSAPQRSEALVQRVFAGERS
jgi:hypothetical protein